MEIEKLFKCNFGNIIYQKYTAQINVHCNLLRIKL